MRRLIAIPALLAGGLLLAGCAPAAPGIPGTSPFVGTWVGEQPRVGDVPTLHLGADGGLGGTDGCNVLFGDWTASGSTITFAGVGGTMMFCEGVDDWLNQAATGEVTDRTLTVKDADGQTIGELHRAS